MRCQTGDRQIVSVLNRAFHKTPAADTYDLKDKVKNNPRAKVLNRLEIEVVADLTGRHSTFALIPSGFDMYFDN